LARLIHAVILDTHILQLRQVHHHSAGYWLTTSGRKGKWVENGVVNEGNISHWRPWYVYGLAHNFWPTTSHALNNLSADVPLPEDNHTYRHILLGANNVLGLPPSESRVTPHQSEMCVNMWSPPLPMTQPGRRRHGLCFFGLVCAAIADATGYRCVSWTS
jgi:hypothetical protein